MEKTFDYYRSTNGRLHAVLDQEDHYARYLRRIERIVDKKPLLDRSPSLHMGFRNKCREISRVHQSNEKVTGINQENQLLLDKIIHVKNRKNDKFATENYSLALYERRFREQEKINEENRKIALRVISQQSKIDLSRPKEYDSRSRAESPRRSTEKSFFESRVKERKLPKLMQLR